VNQAHADKSCGGHNQEFSPLTSTAIRTTKLQPSSSIATAGTRADQRLQGFVLERLSCQVVGDKANQCANNRGERDDHGIGS
jgi:hypothetical protein